MHTHGDFIAFLHWELRRAAPWPDILFSRIILTSPSTILIMSSAWLGHDKSFVGHDQGSNPQVRLPQKFEFHSYFNGSLFEINTLGGLL